MTDYSALRGLALVRQFRPESHKPVRPERYRDVKDYHNNFAFLAEGSEGMTK